MKTFQYEAMVRNHENQHSTVDAYNQEDAVNQIRNMGMFPIRVSEVKISEVKSKKTLKQDYLKQFSKFFWRIITRCKGNENEN